MARKALAAALVSLVSLVMAACSASPDTTDPGADAPSATDDALTSPRSVSLLYEGTCDFLHQCSSFSRKLPAGEVQWACGGTTCDDSDLWIAAPAHKYCNRQVKICRSGTCATATVKDVSDVQGWEGSNGVMEALGLSHSVDVKACSGSGGGHVTVQLL